MKNKGYAKFWRTNKVHYVQVANGKFALLPGKGSPYVGVPSITLSFNLK